MVVCFKLHKQKKMWNGPNTPDILVPLPVYPYSNCIYKIRLILMMTISKQSYGERLKGECNGEYLPSSSPSHQSVVNGGITPNIPLPHVPLHVFSYLLSFSQP